MLQLEIIGNLGSNAEIKRFGDKDYVSFSVAHTEKRKDAQGQMQETTTWVSVLWYGNGGGAFQYLTKGAKVFVRGNATLRTYQDRNGYTQAALSCNASEVFLCGTRENSGQQPQAGYAPPPTTRQAAQPQQPKPVDVENDLPFN